MEYIKKKPHCRRFYDCGSMVKRLIVLIWPELAKNFKLRYMDCEGIHTKSGKGKNSNYMWHNR